MKTEGVFYDFCVTFQPMINEHSDFGGPDRSTLKQENNHRSNLKMWQPSSKLSSLAPVGLKGRWSKGTP